MNNCEVIGRKQIWRGGRENRVLYASQFSMEVSSWIGLGAILYPILN